MTRIEYHRYLHSAAWKDVKRRYAESDRPKECYICGGEPSLHHHITYARVGNELLDDIVRCCSPCHQAIHHAHSTRTTKQGLSTVTHAVRAMFQQCVKDGTADDFQEITHDYYESKRRVLPIDRPRLTKPKVTISQIVSNAA